MNAPPQPPAIETLRDLEPISSLPPEQIREIAEHSRLERLDPGVWLFHEGDTDQQAVYLLQGRLELSSRGNAKRLTVEGGSREARHPIADQTPRRMSAVTTSPVSIVRIDKELLDTLLTWGQISAPEEEVVMSEDGIITIDKAGWLRTMIKSPTFRHLPPANIEELLYRLEPIIVHAGDVIIRQGDTGDYFYMIDEGIALVTRNPDNDEDSIEMAELNKGDTFGEAALISDNPRNATVSMMTDGILLRLSKEDFNKLLKQPTLQWLDFEQAARKVADGAVWIDVRLPTEYNRAHLPGAVNIPMNMLHKEARGLDKAVPYVCYCQTGRRSSAAAFVLKNYGLDASVLQDGLQSVPNGEMSG